MRRTRVSLAFGVAAAAAFLGLAPGASAVPGDFVPAPSGFETTGEFVDGVALGDFNGDDKTDQAIPSNSSDTITILLGDGTGNFTAPPTSPEAGGNGSGSVGVGDFNGDGKADLAAGAFFDNNVTILLGDGTGNFSPAPTSPEAAGNAPAEVAVGDFNGDTKTDLAVANFFGGNLTILLGAGTGNFTAAASSPEPLVGGSPSSLAVGDLNGDGKTDLAVDSGESTVEILLGAGTGNFTAAPTSPEASGAGTRAVAIGNFNGDSTPDLAVADQGSDDVTVLLGVGGGDFSPTPTSPEAAGDQPTSVAVGDFDQDGNSDLAITNFESDNVTIMLGSGTGDFTAAPTSPEAQAESNGPVAVAVGRFDANSTDDLAVGNNLNGTVSILLGVLHQQLALTTAGTGGGYVDSTPAGTDCGQNVAGHTTCSQRYIDGSRVTLIAHTNADSDFGGFSGPGCSGVINACVVTMDQARAVTATFALDTTGPDTKITKKPKKHTTKPKAKIRFTTSEDDAKFTCKLDDRKAKPCSSPYRKGVEPGKHVFEVSAIDAVGNADPTPAKARWKVLER
jgi:hypothetical protein